MVKAANNRLSHHVANVLDNPTDQRVDIEHRSTRAHKS
jgi:hypothetical protein